MKNRHDFMTWMYRHLVRPVLFAQDPEEIHRLTMSLLAWASRYPLAIDAMNSFLGAPELPSTVFGLWFPNPVGLAAGMDKDGEAVPIWPALGFGHVELGAVTWKPQPGNPLPRVFRAVADEAIVNRMGFNNAGAEAMAAALLACRQENRWPAHPVGINLGKNKTTPLEEAAADYAECLRILWDQADFFVVNVSSPNTPNLRQLQNKAALDEILAALQNVRQQQTQSSRVIDGHEHSTSAPATTPAAGDHTRKPILVKVAPDLEYSALDEILELVTARQMDGIIATNTTIERPATDEPECRRAYAETGGLSGKPLRARSTEIIRHLYRQSRGRVPIIGVGGIASAADAWDKIAAGASLVQIYTGMVFEGPSLARDIVNGLLTRLAARGLTEIRQAVGCENLV